MGDVARETTWGASWMWTFVSIVESRRFQRWSNYIEAEARRLSITPYDELTLKAIILIEMSQRSVFWRGVERAVDLLQAVLHTPRRLTLGPFQMRHASFRPSAQIAQAAQLLVSMKRDTTIAPMTDLARFWNGSSVRQPGASIGYADALRLAIKVLSVSH